VVFLATIPWAGAEWGGGGTWSLLPRRPDVLHQWARMY
jgi:hypothetical protein